MKKLKLTVSEPCHENWEGMMPEQQGRFCAACQKTVVDFTTMTDQQIAEFFQKPAGSVCGRFHVHQLNRPIPFPEAKRFLPRHFFRYSWPALLLLLNGCDEQRDNSYEILGAVLETNAPDTPPMMGNALPQVMPVRTDSLLFQKPVPIGCTLSVDIKHSILKGDTTLIVQDETEESALQDPDTAFVAIDSTAIAVDTLKITGYPDNEIFLMGAVDITHHTNEEKKEAVSTSMPSVKTRVQEVVIFPNPVAKGQSLNVHFPEPFSGIYQLYTVLGQLIQTGSLAVGKDQRWSVPVQACPAGTYFIRLTDETSKQAVTKKFMVQ